MNPTLQQIHELLCAQHAALAQSLDGLTDVDQVKAIIMEMKELLHRIDLVQNLLFTESSKKLDGTMKGINTANTALAKSIKSIDDLADFLTAASNFLAAVDEAVDIAKSVAV